MVLNSSNPDIMYAGKEDQYSLFELTELKGTGEGFGVTEAPIGGGILRSTDAGVTWTVLESTIPLDLDSPWLYVNKLALSSRNPSIIYAGLYFVSCSN
jgi:hypothetical protein